MVCDSHRPLADHTWQALGKARWAVCSGLFNMQPPRHANKKFNPAGTFLPRKRGTTAAAGCPDVLPARADQAAGIRAPGLVGWWHDCVADQRWAAQGPVVWWRGFLRDEPQTRHAYPRGSISVIGWIYDIYDRATRRFENGQPGADSPSGNPAGRLAG